MNSVIGTTIFGVITLAICAFIWIAGGKAQKEIEEKKRLEEERQKQELIKARAQVTGPKQVGKIELTEVVGVQAFITSIV